MPTMPVRAKSFASSRFPCCGHGRLHMMRWRSCRVIGEVVFGASQACQGDCATSARGSWSNGQKIASGLPLITMHCFCCSCSEFLQKFPYSHQFQVLPCNFLVGCAEFPRKFAYSHQFRLLPFNLLVVSRRYQSTYWCTACVSFHWTTSTSTIQAWVLPPYPDKYCNRCCLYCRAYWYLTSRANETLRKMVQEQVPDDK